MIPVLKNPSPADLLKMFDEHETDTLRALSGDKGDIYAWPFHAAMHGEMKKYLGLGGDFEHVIIAREDIVSK